MTSLFVYEQCVQQNLIYSTLKIALLFERLTREGLGSFWDRHMQLGDYWMRKGFRNALLQQRLHPFSVVEPAGMWQIWSHASFRLATINNDKKLEIKQINV